MYMLKMLAATPLIKSTATYDETLLNWSNWCYNKSKIKEYLHGAYLTEYKCVCDSGVEATKIAMENKLNLLDAISKNQPLVSKFKEVFNLAREKLWKDLIEMEDDEIKYNEAKYSEVKYDENHIKFNKTHPFSLRNEKQSEITEFIKDNSVLPFDKFYKEYSEFLMIRILSDVSEKLDALQMNIAMFLFDNQLVIAEEMFKSMHQKGVFESHSDVSRFFNREMMKVLWNLSFNLDY